MAKVRRINVSQIDGDSSTGSNKRPNGEIALYENGNNFDLVIHDGMHGVSKNRVLAKGIFYGHGEDSADGLGLNTIKLIPDADIVQSGSEQYLIVDPTFPNHIHIRPGGAIDNSTTDLFVGGEKNFVKISDGDNSVRISVDDAVDGTKEWTFNYTGSTHFPNFTFPSADGTIGQTLITDGGGTLSWSDPPVGPTGPAGAGITTVVVDLASQIPDPPAANTLYLVRA